LDSPSSFIGYSSLLVAAGTLLYSVLISRRMSKSKEEREASTLQLRREADRLDAEERRITVNAAHEAVRIVRDERDDARKEAIALRILVDKQIGRIDKQGKTIRRQNVRIELQQEQIGTLRRALVRAEIEVPPLPSITDADLWPDDDEDT
jgi:hypothetical protein